MHESRQPRKCPFAHVSSLETQLASLFWLPILSTLQNMRMQRRRSNTIAPSGFGCVLNDLVHALEIENFLSE